MFSTILIYFVTFSAPFMRHSRSSAAASLSARRLRSQLQQFIAGHGGHGSFATHMPRMWGLCRCCSLGKTISGPEKLEMPQSERLVIAGCIVLESWSLGWLHCMSREYSRAAQTFEACCRIICQWRKALLLYGPRTIREHTQRCKSRLTDQHVLCFVISGAFLSWMSAEHSWTMTY